MKSFIDRFFLLNLDNNNQVSVSVSRMSVCIFFCDNRMLLFVIIKTNIAFYVSVSGDEPADDESSVTYAAVVPKQRKTKGLLDLTLLT